MRCESWKVSVGEEGYRTAVRYHGGWVPVGMAVNQDKHNILFAIYDAKQKPPYSRSI